MPNNLEPQDPRAIWQSQPTERPSMTLDLIHLKARQLQSQTRQQLLANTAIACFVMVISLICFWRVNEPVLRFIFAIAMSWALVEQYLLHQHIWPKLQPGESATETGLQFYRRAIAARRYASRRLLQWSIGPVILTVVGFLVALATIAIGSGTPLTRMLPFASLFVLWLVAVVAMNTKKQRELKHELEELEAHERRN